MERLSNINTILLFIVLAVIIFCIGFFIVVEYMKHRALVQSINANRCQPIQYMMLRYEINIAVGLSINRNLLANSNIGELYLKYAAIVDDECANSKMLLVDEFHNTVRRGINKTNADYSKILHVFNDDIKFAIVNTIRRAKFGHKTLINPCEVSIFIREWLIMNNIEAL